MNCPTCNKPGYEPPKRGRPQRLDETKMRKLKAKGLSNRAIAAQLEVSEGAIRAALKRAK